MKVKLKIILLGTLIIIVNQITIAINFNKPDTFDFSKSENMLEGYIDFLKSKSVDSLIIIEISKGKKLEYSSFRCFLFIDNGRSYFSYYSNYTMPKQNQKKLISHQFISLPEKKKRILLNCFSKHIADTISFNSNEKPFKNMWKKRKWRNIIIPNSNDLSLKNSLIIKNRALSNTPSEYRSIMKKYKQTANRLFDTINPIISVDLKNLK
jgi:hypothetical protein